MSAPGALRVIVVGRSPEKMQLVTAVIEAHGFATTGVFSEDEALQAIAAHEVLFAVIAGGSIDAPAQERLRAAGALKGAALITANIGDEDPETHFKTHVIPRLIEARQTRGR